MSVRFNEVVEKSHLEHFKPILGDGVNEGQIKEFEEASEFLYNLMSTDGKSREMPKVSMKEALASSDASVLFPRVISDKLVRPREHMLFLQNEIAKTVNVDTVNYIEFPTLGALRAFDVAETGEYPEQTLAFTQHMTSVRVGKVGLLVSMSEEIIKDSMWDVMALYVEAAGFAMRRFKEQKLVAALDKGRNVIDNNTTTAADWSNGKHSDAAATPNFSMTFDDHIRLMASLMQHEYIPTHMLIHPMAWSIWATDPLMRTQFLAGGGNIGTAFTVPEGPQFDQSSAFPWNVQYRVTPFMPLTRAVTAGTTLAQGCLATNTVAMASPYSSGAANLTDICMLDANNSLLIMQKDAPSTEEFNDPRRDVLSMKIKERYGVTALNGGRSIAWARNIRLKQNFEAYWRVKSVTG